MVSLRYYVLGGQGVGLSFVSLFSCLLGLITGIGLYVFVVGFLEEIEMASAFLLEFANMETAPQKSEGMAYLDMARQYLSFMQGEDVKKVKSLIGLGCIGIGALIFIFYMLDFLLFYGFMILLNLLFGNKLSIQQQGRLLVFPWIIYSLICIFFTVTKNFVLFWWLTLILRIISPSAIVEENAVRAENMFAHAFSMWWLSLVAFFVFVVIYMVQAKGLSIYKERQAELFQKDK